MGKLMGHVECMAISETLSQTQWKVETDPEVVL